MTRIDYEIFEGRAYAVRCNECEGSGIMITASPAASGYVMICNRAFDLKDGACRPELRALPDGDLDVSILADGALVRADALNKCGRTLRLASPDAQRIRELESDVLSLKQAVALLCNKVDEIRADIDGASVL